MTVSLPVSKSDQEGRGAARRLAPECRGSSLLEMLDSSTCAVCAVLRQQDRLLRRFGKSSLAQLAELEVPFFPCRDGGQPTKTQVIKAWKRLQPGGFEKDLSGHSARRSGAKRRARLGWSLWQIQFLGRWAASTVVDYVEEALSEMTASWSVATSSSPSASAASGSAAHQGSAPGAGTSGIQLGTEGGVPSLSERLEDRMEALLEEHRVRAAESTQVPAVPDLTEPVSEWCALAGSKVHRFPAGVLDWPRTLWATSCGWRCGLSSKFRFMEVSKLEFLSHSKCGRLEGWLTRSKQDGGGASARENAGAAL